MDLDLEHTDPSIRIHRAVDVLHLELEAVKGHLGRLDERFLSYKVVLFSLAGLALVVCGAGWGVAVYLDSRLDKQHAGIIAEVNSRLDAQATATRSSIESLASEVRAAQEPQPAIRSARGRVR